MVIYGREGFQVFLEPFSKSSRGLSNILLITVHPVTMITVDDSTLFLDWVFVLWRHQEVLDGSASITMHLQPKFSANVFDAFAEPSIVRYHYTGSLGDVTIFVVCLFSGWIVSLLLYFVYSPCGVLAVLQCILQMFFFFVQQLCVGADGVSSVLQCSNHTILCC